MPFFFKSILLDMNRLQRPVKWICNIKECYVILREPTRRTKKNRQQKMQSLYFSPSRLYGKIPFHNLSFHFQKMVKCSTLCQQHNAKLVKLWPLSMHTSFELEKAFEIVSLFLQKILCTFFSRICRISNNNHILSKLTFNVQKLPLH